MLSPNFLVWRDKAMVTTAMEEQKSAPCGLTMGRQVWVVAVQVAALAVAATAWVFAKSLATAEGAVSPPLPVQGLVGLMALAMLLVALVPGWRRGKAGALLCGIGLATVCWLTIDRTWDIPYFAIAYIPLMTPVVAGAAVALAVWGAIARAGLAGQARLGNAALVALVLVIVWTLLFFFGINHSAHFSKLYAVELFQVQEIIAAALLYPLALWLGGVGVRAQSRLTLLPAGMTIILAAFLVMWHVR